MKKRWPLTTHELALGGLWAALIAVGSLIKLPIPFVTLTLQLFFANLAGMLLGAKIAMISVAIYIAVGLSGVPVFYGGMGGITYLFDINFGFILGMLFGSYLCGKLSDTSTPPGFMKYFFAGVCNLSVNCIVGVVYYTIIANLFIKGTFSTNQLTLYILFFIVPFDLMLCIGSAALAKRLVPVIKLNWDFVLKHRSVVPVEFEPAPEQ